MISDETLERVRDSADIVQIVGEWVKLKKTGADFRGPCPFHNGKGANFSVVPGKGLYYCFVCHESGDVIKFVQKKLSLDFTSAVKFVGEKAGIEVIDTPTRPQAVDPNAKHWEVLASSAQWFRAQLQDVIVGREALQYLTNRGIDAAAMARFELGYSPRDDQALRKHLHSLGFNDDRQIDAGILKPAADGRDARISFRDRVMFPIVDDRGNYVAFGGRAMGDATPKYLNSAASDVYHKGETLYGMHSAKHAMRRERRAIVVEGYMDAIRVALSGIEPVVAPLGTALTEEQAKLIVRYAPEIFLLYDSDKAGQTATFKSGLALLRQGAAVRVVSLPSGEDPDTYVRAHGRTGLETQLEQAMDLFDRQVQLVERKGMFGDISRQRVAIDLLLPTIRAAVNPLTRDMYVTRLAEKTGLDKVVLLKEAEAPETVYRRGTRTTDTGTEIAIVRKDMVPGSDRWASGEPMPTPLRKFDSWSGKKGGGKWKGQGSAIQWRSSLVPPQGRIEEPAERALITAMLADRAQVERIAERHGPADFRDVHYKALFGVLLMAGPDDGFGEIADKVDDHVGYLLRELLEKDVALSPDAVDVPLNLAKIEVRPIDARLEEIKLEMRSALKEQQQELQVEEFALTKQRKTIQPVRAPRGKRRK